MAAETLTVEGNKSSTVCPLTRNGGCEEKGPVIRSAGLCALIVQ